jgi:hypothetical protein
MRRLHHLVHHVSCPSRSVLTISDPVCDPLRPAETSPTPSPTQPYSVRSQRTDSLASELSVRLPFIPSAPCPSYHRLDLVSPTYPTTLIYRLSFAATIVPGSSCTSSLSRTTTSSRSRRRRPPRKVGDGSKSINPDPTSRPVVAERTSHGLRRSVRKAYLKKAAECHPDKHVGTSEEDRATEAFKAINGESHLRTPSPLSRSPSPGALFWPSSLGLRYRKCYGPGVLDRANTTQRLMRRYSTPTSERNTTRSSPHFAWRTARPVPNPGLSPHTSRPHSSPFHPCSPCRP